jgi:hypothetical protein
MVGDKKYVSVMLGLATAALAGCATTPPAGPGEAADQLERSATAFESASRAAYYGSTNSLTRDARELAQQTRQLRGALADKGTDEGYVKDAFERVSHTYRVLREEVQRTDAQEFRDDLQPVTEAYLDVERHVGGGARYASDEHPPRNQY